MRRLVAQRDNQTPDKKTDSKPNHCTGNNLICNKADAESDDRAARDDKQKGCRPFTPPRPVTSSPIHRGQTSALQRLSS